MTKCCAIFNVRYNFFNILNPFPKYFTTVVNDQRLALLKYVKNYEELKVPFHTHKTIQEYHHPLNRTQRHRTVQQNTLHVEQLS